MEFGELFHVIRADDVGPVREDLSGFHEGRAEVREHDAELLGSGHHVFGSSEVVEEEPGRERAGGGHDL